MALTKNFPADMTKQVRRNAAGSKQGVGDDPHMIIGSVGSGSTEYRHRSLVRFHNDWTGVKRVVKAEIAVQVELSSTHFTVGSHPKVRIERVTSGWSEGSGGEAAWSSGQYQWPSSTGGYEQDVPRQDEVWVFLDVTYLLQGQAPASVLFPNGGAGQHYGNSGFLLRTPGNELDNEQRIIFYSFDHATPARRPYIKLTYDPLNQPPVAPTLTGPDVSNNTFGDIFEGNHSDPDLDPMSAREIVVYPAGGATAVWTLPANLLSAGSDESQTGHFSVPLSLAAGSLKLQTNYEWVARTQDPSGAWGPYSGRRALRITSSPPVVVATNVTTVDAMANALFGGIYSDPENNPLTLFQLQMRAVVAHTDVAFTDPTTYVWDTGETIPTLDEVTTNLISRQYAGKALGPATYTYRIKVQDSSGVWSAWSYDDFDLTTAFNPDPGSIDLVTQIARNAPVRIALYKMGPDRCPGALIGHIDDPLDLGSSRFLNGGGELYFTLPALHPYCPYVEPHSTHYAVEQYYGDRYRVLFGGIITDFDAVADEMVAYGSDYLGLLQTAVDERYDPAKAETPAPTGSKYNNLTVDAIIRDQLTYHKALANSPVAFIQIGSLAALAERATIYSTYTEALPFINGLIDSHKQGTGREARFYERPIASPGTTVLAAAAAAGATNIKVGSVTNFAVGNYFRLGDIDVHKITVVGTTGAGGTGITFTGGLTSAYAVGAAVIEQGLEWALVDPWGKDRPNIMLEYGGLVNDFRVVALGDFGTRVLGVGQKRGEVKVYRKVGTGGLDEAQWGRRSKTRFYADIIDENDLQRRVNEDASQLSKVGKRIALAIEADVLAPFDGWDLGDSIVINIVRGVVDTSRYGSLGLWTIYGVEWRYHPDGHTDLTLTISPKKSATPPNPDLIPSSNPGMGRDWQVGYGVPTVYGDPPSPTP